jgi:hypothetical protein
MENWQFLIQKQGDHTWRTLELPNLKLLAGNYRVLARSYLSNTDVEVRVTHILTEEVPPKRRILKRSRRTNAEGLMAVIPFTHFKPGTWELRCSGDVMSDMLGKSWQHTLVIQVLQLETNPLSPSKVDEETDIASEIDTEVNIVMNHSTPIWFKAETTEEILQNLLDLALPKDEPLDEETIENAPTLPSPLPLNLTLEQDTYVARWGDSLIIHGCVEVNEIENLEYERFYTDGMSQFRLEIALRSPLESRILTKIKQPLTDHILPFSFSTLVDIPPKCQSKLLLANINLYGALSDVGEIILLASHTFTITADVTELLALQISSLDPHHFVPESNLPKKPKPSVNVGLELFNLAKTPKLAQFHILKRSPNQPLPPQIKPFVSWEGISPQLPNLPNHSTPNITDDAAKNSSNKTLITPPIDLKKLVIKPINNSFPYLRRLKVKTVKEETVGNKLETGNLPSLAPQLPTVVPLSAQIPELPADNPQQADESVMADTSYAELIAEIVAGVINDEELDVVDTQENYSILISEELDVVDTQENYPILVSEELDVVDTQNSSPLVQRWMETQGFLLTEANAEVLLSGEIDSQEDPVVENTLLEIHDPEIVNLLNPILSQPIWLSQEIVIDDLIIEVDDGSSSGESGENDHDCPSVNDEIKADFSPVMIESFPTPQLSLPEGELVAGTSVVVRVELPEVLSSVAVKLWVEDYQTRSLLDGPHILSDLRANAWGGSETTIYLKVPFGCLEIRLAAIALNPTTQQESNKVTVIKTVIPPDLPTIELDEILGM